MEQKNKKVIKIIIIVAILCSSILIYFKVKELKKIRQRSLVCFDFCHSISGGLYTFSGFQPYLVMVSQKQCLDYCIQNWEKLDQEKISPK